MKKILLSALAASLILSACGSSNSDIKKKIMPDPVANLFNDYQGLWEMKGTGTLWAFEDSTFISYNYNSFGCVQVESKPLTAFEPLLDYLSLSDNQTKFAFSHNASDPYNFEKSEQTPESCLPENQLDTNDLQVNFDYFWHTLNDYYAFFEVREIDWQAVYQQYRPMITDSTSQEEFAEIIDEIMTDFGDGHLSMTDDETFEADGTRLNGFALEVFRSPFVDAEDDFEQAAAELFHINDQVLLSLLQDEQLHTYQEGDAIRWGKLADNVGYLRIDRVQNIFDQDEQEEPDDLIEILALIEQDIAATDTVMQAAINDLEQSDAIILDLRFNSGGFDNVSLKIASYFNDSEQVIGTKKIHNNNYQSDIYQLKIAASPTTAYTKPIYVITGRSTGSAGEVLSMALKSLPHSTLVGEPTNGSVSDSLEHEMPNGWDLSLSHQQYSDHQGQTVESIGVTPDVVMPVYASQDVMYLSNTPIDYVLQQMQTTSFTAPTIADVEQAFTEHFVPTNVPGIAAIVIKDGKVVYQHAQGLANIAENIPVTLNTPFNVGSISKAVLATGIMQQVEQENISLDDPLSSMNLPFDANNPDNLGTGINLRHLVTHTSGIKDNDGYGCSYYIHETGKSLYYQFGVESCPEQATIDTTSFFANDYFNVNGKYYFDGIFNEGEYGLPDMGYSYSNVGAALAAYAIEQKLGINLSEQMQQEIFTPLNLANTRWFHTELDEQNPKAVQYTLDKNSVPIEVPEFSYPTFYDGDLNTSANDLAKFLITITNGGVYQDTRILARETVEQMLGAQTEVLNRHNVQGVFWYKQGSFVGHNGGDPGTNAIMQYNEQTQTGIIVLMNGEDGYLGEDETDGLLLPLMSTLYRYGLNQ